MHRIDHATKDADLFGSGKDGFTEGTPGTEATTVVTDDWLNGVQEEICNTVENAGIALVKGTRDQLSLAVLLQLGSLAASNWTYTDPGTTGDHYKDSADDGSIIVYIGGTNVMYSYDGLTLSAGSASGINNAVAYGNGYFVKVGTSGALDYAADPTGAWTANNQGSTTFRDVMYVGGTWVAVGDSGALYHATDPTGSWTSNTQGSANLRRLGHDGTNWIVVGDSGTLYYAADPTGSWTSNTQGSSSLRGVAYRDSDSLYVAVGTSGTILTHATLSGTWDSQTGETTEDINDVICNAGIFVAVGDLGSAPEYGLQISGDGETWSLRYTSAVGSTDFNSINVHKNAFVICGDYDAIYRSLGYGLA